MIDTRLGLSRGNRLAIAALALLALLAPWPLYLLALSCFGLPHVLWELAWIRHSGGRMPTYWWLLLLVLLLIQAASRLALWHGGWDRAGALQVEVLSLALALLLVWLLPVRAGRTWLARGLGLLGACLLMLAGLADDPQWSMALLVLLSVAHNFTPIGLARLGCADGASRVPVLARLFLLPLALIPLAGLVAGAGWGHSLAHWQPPEVIWLREHLEGLGGVAWRSRWSAGLLSALVLAQCLHYYAVIRLLPASLGQNWSMGPWRWPAVALSALLALAFAWDFADGRRLYAVAAGFHAWLEWPVLLCFLAGWLRQGPAQGIR